MTLFWYILYVLIIIVMFSKHDTTTMFIKISPLVLLIEEVHPKKKIKTCITLTCTKGQNKQNSYKKFLSLQIDDWEVSSILFEIEEETHIHYSWLSTLLLNTRKAA